MMMARTRTTRRREEEEVEVRNRQALTTPPFSFFSGAFGGAAMGPFGNTRLI